LEKLDSAQQHRSASTTNVGDKALGKAPEMSQRNCGSPLPGNIQGQVGWDSNQPGIVSTL